MSLFLLEILSLQWLMRNWQPVKKSNMLYLATPSGENSNFKSGSTTFQKPQQAYGGCRETESIWLQLKKKTI